MLLVNTEDAEEKAGKVFYWATQAREPARWYQHTEIGYNYCMSNTVSEGRFLRGGVCIPGDSKMTDDDSERVCVVVRDK